MYSSGVCGKVPEVSNRQDDLIVSLINLARRAGGKSPGSKADELMIQGLFTTITNVNFDTERISETINAMKRKQLNFLKHHYSKLKIYGKEMKTLSLFVPHCFLV